MNAQMITALRKEGKVDEAYQLSKEMLLVGFVAKDEATLTG